MNTVTRMLGNASISRSGPMPFPMRLLDNGVDPILLGIIGVILILFLSITLAAVVLARRKRTKADDPTDEMLEVAQRLADSINGIDEEEKAQAAFRAAQSSAQQTSMSPRSKILAEMGARQLLDQVNSHILDGRGEISSRSGEIRIEWTDLEDTSVQRLIMIRVQDSSTLLINGQPFPATREGAQQGLISCLKGMKLE